MEVTNILEMKACELVDEEKVPVNKNGLHQEDLQHMKKFIHEEKEKMQKSKKSLFGTKPQIQTTT